MPAHHNTSVILYKLTLPIGILCVMLRKLCLSLHDELHPKIWSIRCSPMFSAAVMSRFEWKNVLLNMYGSNGSPRALSLRAWQAYCSICKHKWEPYREQIPSERDEHDTSRGSLTRQILLLAVAAHIKIVHDEVRHGGPGVEDCTRRQHKIHLHKPVGMPTFCRFAINTKFVTDSPLL